MTYSAIQSLIAQGVEDLKGCPTPWVDRTERSGEALLDMNIKWDSDITIVGMQEASKMMHFVLPMPPIVVANVGTEQQPAYERVVGLPILPILQMCADRLKDPKASGVPTHWTDTDMRRLLRDTMYDIWVVHPFIHQGDTSNAAVRKVADWYRQVYSIAPVR